jgi:hypothetical protein
MDAHPVNAFEQAGSVLDRPPGLDGAGGQQGQEKQ